MELSVTLATSILPFAPLVMLCGVFLVWDGASDIKNGARHITTQSERGRHDDPTGKGILKILGGVGLLIVSLRLPL
ncbi:MAG: hypothetical protein AAB403_24500 [Planctomycetota bacterium]